MDAANLREIATIQFRYTSYVIAANLKDLTDEQGVFQPPAGNCLNWVTGHIAEARGGALRMLGQTAPYPADKYARYVRGSDPILAAAGAVPLSEIVADIASTEDGLKNGLAAMDDAQLAARAPFSPTDNPTETVGSLLAGLVFHEAYHAGQLGVLRRLVGVEGVIK